MEIKAYFDETINVPRYKQTKRPVMPRLLQLGKYQTLSHFYLPVVRYSNIYHPETEKGEFCGTFYFYEPESTTVLDLGRAAIFGSKVHAFWSMVTHDRQELDNQISRIPAWSKLNFGDDVKKYKLIKRAFYSNIYRNENDVKILPLIETTSLYPTDESKVWSKDQMENGPHDFLDQPICEEARKRGIDTIILQHEVGEYRSVTEILDTRLNSYEHVIDLDEENIKVENLPIVERYPTIWFTDNGLLTDGEKNTLAITHDWNINHRLQNRIEKSTSRTDITPTP